MIKLRTRLKTLAISAAALGILDVLYVATHLMPSAFARSEGSTMPRAAAPASRAWATPSASPASPASPDPVSLATPPTLEAIYFAFDTATVGPGARASLRNVANIMTARPQLGLSVIGRADPSGAPAYNLYLSRKRARRVKHVLETEGILGSRIETRGLGAVPTSTTIATTTRRDRAQQRRVDLEWRHEQPSE